MSYEDIVDIDDLNDEENEEDQGEAAVVVDDDEMGEEGDEYAPVVQDDYDSDDFDLEGMMEKKDTLDLELLAKKQCEIIPSIPYAPVPREGYQEYNIEPARHPKKTKDLIQIEDLSEAEQEAFRDFSSLNYIQSQIYDKAMKSDRSLLICAPTGAGKTNIALLTMLREIIKHPLSDKSGGYDTTKFKIIYIAPIKALVQEIVENFEKKLGGPPFNLVVKELTGDHQLNQGQISRAQIIVCTPEKWDIVTRKSIDRLYTKLVRLVIFDEIHLLHNERGATLEALVARIKRHKHMEGDHIRIVGLSATLPNYKDVARFISPDDPQVRDSAIYFDSSYRPIPLRQQYIALTESKKVFRKINDIVYEKVIERLSSDSYLQILVFVHSRPDTMKTAEFITTQASDEQKLGLFLTTEKLREEIDAEGDNLNYKLKNLLQFGIGTHHAGMSKQERAFVEDLFRRKRLRVLVSTATLAWGVNLPARTVIIKGTQVYRDGQWTDLDSLDVTQMLGRAGRPGQDREGEGIVITQQSKVAFYISLMTEQLPVESRLIGRLAEFINSECVVGNIEDLEGAKRWISETYLNSRMKSVLRDDARQYMAMYGLKPLTTGASESSASLELVEAGLESRLVQHRHDLAYNAVCKLDERGLILFDRTSKAITSTELGRIASNYNCSSKTMQLFYKSLDENTKDIELFRIFSLADEFKDIFVRRDEELDLQTMMAKVPYPIDDRKANAGANKVNVLLQIYIFRLNVSHSDLICDMHFIKDNAARVARAIYEVVLLKGYASVAELALDLCRKVDLRMTACQSPLRLFAAGGDGDLEQDIVARLEKRNYHLDELRLLKGDKLAELLRCDHRTGDRIHRMLKHLPRLKMEASVKPMSATSLKVDLMIRTDFVWNDKYHGTSERFWLFVEDVNQERLLHQEIVHVRKRTQTEDLEVRVSFFVPYLVPTHPFYYIKLLPDRWFGCDHQMSLYIDHLLLPDDGATGGGSGGPDSRASITQVLDIDPVRVKALENPLFESYYADKFKGADFNQIQTQSFKQLYKSDEDVILLAPAGSGKTTCAELALIHNINLRGTASKCAYIAANAKAAHLVHEHWTKLFRHYGVLQLTGQHKVDAARVDDSKTNIVIGDPTQWHILSLVRSKKYRKLFNKFQLFIVDDIHRLNSGSASGDTNSTTLEWVCSKIRLLTKLNTESPARIVTLGSPVATADSLRSWLAFERGNREPVLLNYPASVRPVKLELAVQRFHHYDYRMRLLTMQRPAYRLVHAVSRGYDPKPALVFVADFQQARELASSFMRFSQSEGRENRFLSSVSRSDLEQVHELELRDALALGVGYLYAGMDPGDRTIVERSYNSRQVLVLVATLATCWSLECRSYLTVVMDTQQHDGEEARDYELTDVMQMVGLTGRPLRDHDCRCVIMCQHAKASLYERFLSAPLPAESDLPESLISFVNYEISTGALAELNNIYKPYLAHTYFYKRISINPNYYGVVVPTTTSSSSDDAEQKARVFGTFFNNFVNKIALELEKNEFMTMEGSHENPSFAAGLLAKISLEYYIDYNTLVNYNKWLSADSNLHQLRRLELIELLATSTAEFESLSIRHGELEDLNQMDWRYTKRRGSEDLDASSFKIKMLLLSQYQRDQVEGELIHDRRLVVALSYRLLMAVVDIAWLKDSFHLAETALRLAKKLTPFQRSARLVTRDMAKHLKVTRGSDSVKLELMIEREDDPFSFEEFRDQHNTMPATMYRDEGWCFLINGQSRLTKKDSAGSSSKRAAEEPEDKFVLFKRVKTPVRGKNDYKLEFELTDNADSYLYTLYFISDFYPTDEDPVCVKNIDIR